MEIENHVKEIKEAVQNLNESISYALSHHEELEVSLDTIFIDQIKRPNKKQHIQVRISKKL